jgi:tetratricopeptide (TPR) repeat protein
LKRIILIAIILTGYFNALQAQRSKVISLFQLIETGKYDDAKKAIEEAVEDEKTAEWPVTWYTRGLLCQTAYEKGVEKNNKKHYELYPDQLFVAYSSYEKALELDPRGRIEKQLPPLYVMLANDFQKLGEKHFKEMQYKEALRAFEKAVEINQNPMLSVVIDTNLIFNTALAAYESRSWEKAKTYLSTLNEHNYSPNVSHMLFNVYLETEDTVAAEQLLIEDIERYKENEALVMLLADLLYKKNEIDRSVEVLDTAFTKKPDKYVFPYTIGLIYQKTEQYRKAIAAYKMAVDLAPEEVKIYTNIGTCYYNTGVEIQENARTISNNRIFLEEKKKSESEFKSAIKWLEEAYEKDPDNQVVIEYLYALYKVLGITDKIKSMEANIR